MAPSARPLSTTTTASSGTASGGDDPPRSPRRLSESISSPGSLLSARRRPSPVESELADERIRAEVPAEEKGEGLSMRASRGARGCGGGRLVHAPGSLEKGVRASHATDPADTVRDRQGRSSRRARVDGRPGLAVQSGGYEGLALATASPVRSPRRGRLADPGARRAR